MTPLVRHARRPLRPVPSLVPIYMSTQTTTTDETATSWADIDIGVPHPKRAVILAAYVGVAGAALNMTVNGHQIRDAAITSAFQVGVIPVPDGATATITLSYPSSLRKAVSVYVYYPAKPFALSSGVDTAAATTNGNVPSLHAQAGGCLIYAGGQNATAGSTWTTTWGGAESVVEDVDAASEATGSYTTGHIVFTGSSVNALDMAETVSGSKQLAAATFGPA